MSNWKTSNYDSANESRHWIGLQFFAEGGDGGVEGAGADGDFETDFAAGLMDGDLENQQGDGQPQGEGGDGDLENQQAGGREEEPGQNEGGEPPQQGEQQPPKEEPPKLVPLTYNGQQIMLPEAAVQQVRDALGMDPIQLLQKGMNYDQKAARELHLLDEYAAASGLNRQQFISQLEQAQQQKQLADELQKVKNEFPETPEAALMEIAKTRIASRRAAEMQQKAEQQQRVQQLQQRAQNAVQEARRKAQNAEWDRYEKETGIHKPEDIPPRVWELTQQGMRPMEAHYRYQAEQAEAAQRVQQKDKDNRKASMGSMGSAPNATGFEADFLGAWKY